LTDLNILSLHLNQLNEAQKEAVLYGTGPLLILAGAGTGKTKVLTSRIINLIHTNIVLPHQILAVTFTNKAAKEMVHRVSEFIPAEGLWLNTFHSIAAKILRRHADIFTLSSNFTIIGVDDQMRLIKNLLKEKDIDEESYPTKIISSIIQRWKDLALSEDDISNTDLKTEAHYIAKDIYGLYQFKLKALDAVDFGDLLLYNIKLFTKNPNILAEYHNRFKYILVDEYQDTNIAQYMWLRLLTNSDKNICCVGDEDQSIYGWRGAEIGNILRFEKDFPNAKIVRLEQNYRSTNNILFAASNLISNNNHRLGKNLWADSGNGEKVKIVTLADSNEEANFVAKEISKLEIDSSTSLKNIAILVRAGFQTRNFEEKFISYGIPYKVVGGLKFYDRQEIKDILAYIRITINPGDSLALERIINIPKRGIGPSNLASITEYAATNRLGILAAISVMIAKNLFKPKIKVELEKLTSLFYEWKEAFSRLEVKAAVQQIVEQSGYLEMWKNDTSIESQGRIENIREFLSALKSFPNINEFMEHVSLVTDNDVSDNDNMVNIMTIHAAKGLEFDIVILPGWEEGIFPNQRNIDELGTKGLEEERRLAYVAITRAKKKLIITNAMRRNIFGKWQNSITSRFIDELPAENIVNVNYGFYSGHNTVSQTKSINNGFYLFCVGDRVKHEKFGEGYVLRISDNQLEISFDNYGSKKILDQFVKRF